MTMDQVSGDEGRVTLETMTADQMSNLLRKLGLGGYVEKFRDKEIDGSKLMYGPGVANLMEDLKMTAEDANYLFHNILERKKK